MRNFLLAVAGSFIILVIGQFIMKGFGLTYSAASFFIGWAACMAFDGIKNYYDSVDQKN